jgi:hypothetical protein
MTRLPNGWQMDDSNHVILFRLPQEVLLDTTRSTKTDITSLDYDILLLVSDHLDLVDRACLGLTCKALALLITSAPRFLRNNKLQQVCRVNGVPPPDLPTTYISMNPEWYTLLPRLSKGWIPREKYKYCWKCNKIFPRDRRFYEDKLSQHKTPGWLWKLELTEQEWRRMHLQAKHEHMITRWLTDNDLVHESLRSPNRSYTVYYPDLGVWAARKPDERGPECPMCLERELINSWQTTQSVFPLGKAAKVALMTWVRVPVSLGVAAGSTVAGALRVR